MNKPIREVISDQYAQMLAETRANLKLWREEAADIKRLEMAQRRIAELEAGLTEVITWAAARDYKSIDKGGENIERLKYIERHARKALEG